MSNIVSETKAACRGREHEVLPVLSITPPRHGKMRCPTLTHDDRDPSWRWDGRKGRWHCTCGGGDILDLVQAMGYANNPVSAALWVREVLGLPPIEEAAWLFDALTDARQIARVRAPVAMRALT